jgi:cystathionine beta-lyase
MNLQRINGVSRFGPVAHEAAYRYGAEWLDEVIRIIGENFVYVRDFFAEYFPGVVISELEGTYLLWADFRCFGMSEKEMTDFLTDECMLYLISGAGFGETGKGYRRINLACPKQVLVDAMERFLKAAQKRGMVK